MSKGSEKAAQRKPTDKFTINNREIVQVKAVSQQARRVAQRVQARKGVRHDN